MDNLARGRHAKPAKKRRARKQAAVVAIAAAGAIGILAITGYRAAPAEPSAEGQEVVNANTTTQPASTSGTASKPRGPVTLGGWLPYWEWSKKPPGTSPKATLLSASAFETTISGTADNLTLVPPRSKTTWQQAKTQWSSAKASTWLSVTDYTAAGVLATTIADPAKRAQLVAQLANAVKAGGHTGLDLDLEGFAYRDKSSSWRQTQPNWISFVIETSVALKAAGKQLSVTSPPIYNNKQDASSGYWVYSWEDIDAHIDKLRIMAYDYSYTHPGPIGPLPWTENILNYATSAVEPSKIELAIPSYGRNWVKTVTGTCPSGANLKRTTLDMASAPQLAKLRNAAISYNSTYAEATFTYQLRYASGALACTVTRTAWFPTAESLEARIRLAHRRGLGGVYLWTPTYLDARAWTAIDSLAKEGIIQGRSQQ